MLRKLRKITDQMLRKIDDAITEYHRHQAIERELDEKLSDYGLINRILGVEATGFGYRKLPEINPRFRADYQMTEAIRKRKIGAQS